MADKKEDFGIVSYVLGITSIVFAFFSSFAGLVLGVIGLVFSKKQKTELSIKAKQLNIIGIVLSAIMLVITIAVTIYFTTKGIGNLPNIPLA
ncbi:MAG: DUF4190 domain-containing protein [Nanoarchaeota archaeon]|nr:DUF4190 domain-containing protein [Nanoarchaeota archaeon]